MQGRRQQSCDVICGRTLYLRLLDGAAFHLFGLFIKTRTSFILVVNNVIRLVADASKRFVSNVNRPWREPQLSSQFTWKENGKKVEE